MNFIVGLIFVLVGLFLIVPISPINFYPEIILYLKGFFPLFIFFVGILMISIHLFTKRKRRKKKEKKKKEREESS